MIEKEISKTYNNATNSQNNLTKKPAVLENKNHFKKAILIKKIEEYEEYFAGNVFKCEQFNEICEIIRREVYLNGAASEKFAATFVKMANLIYDLSESNNKQKDLLKKINELQIQ